MQKLVLVTVLSAACAAKNDYPLSGAEHPDAPAIATDSACPPLPCSMEATRTGDVVTVRLDTAVGAAELVVLDRTAAPTLVAGIANFTTDLVSLDISSATDAKLVALVASTTTLTCEAVVINN
jgi:hypothetical protein